MFQFPGGPKTPAESGIPKKYLHTPLFCSIFCRFQPGVAYKKSCNNFLDELFEKKKKAKHKLVTLNICWIFLLEKFKHFI